MRFELSALCVCACVYFMVYLGSLPSPPCHVSRTRISSSHAQSSTRLLLLYSAAHTFSHSLLSSKRRRRRLELEHSSQKKKFLILFYLFIYFRWRIHTSIRGSSKSRFAWGEEEKRKIDFHSEVSQQKEKSLEWHLLRESDSVGGK